MKKWVLLKISFTTLLFNMVLNPRIKKGKFAVVMNFLLTNNDMV